MTMITTNVVKYYFYSLINSFYIRFYTTMISLSGLLLLAGDVY